MSGIDLHSVEEMWLTIIPHLTGMAVQHALVHFANRHTTAVESEIERAVIRQIDHARIRHDRVSR